MNVYHYTNINAILGIIQEEGLCFRASFFKKFKGEDYDIIQPEGYKVIRDLCNQKGYDFQKDNDIFQPCIVSFCTNGQSDYMWKNYADCFCGGKLILDAEILKRHAEANRYENSDCFHECEYISKVNLQSEIKHYIAKNEAQIPGTGDYQNDLVSILGLLKVQEYKQEEEYRYIRPYKILATAEYDETKEHNCNINLHPEPLKTKYYEEIHFPKEALVGVELGTNSRMNDYELLRSHLTKLGYEINDRILSVNA